MLAIGGLALGGLVVVILLRRQIIAAVQDSRFMRWLIVTLVAIFIGGVALGENIAKVAGW